MVGHPTLASSVDLQVGAFLQPEDGDLTGRAAERRSSEAAERRRWCGPRSKPRYTFHEDPEDAMFGKKEKVLGKLVHHVGGLISMPNQQIFVIPNKMSNLIRKVR